MGQLWVIAPLYPQGEDLLHLSPGWGGLHKASSFRMAYRTTIFFFKLGPVYSGERNLLAILEL